MPKVVDHDDWREQALVEVFPLFARRGYEAVTVRHIANHLGVSVGSLYHYFPSKDAVFENMLRHLAASGAARARDALAAAAPQATAAVADGEVAQFRDILLLMIDYRRVHGDAAPLLAEVIRSCRSTLEGGPGGAEAAVPLLSLLMGLLLQSQLDPTGTTVLGHAPAFKRLSGGAP